MVLTTLHNTPANPNLLLPLLPLLTIYIVYRQETLCIIQLHCLNPGQSNEREFHCCTIKELVLLYSSISDRKGRYMRLFLHFCLIPYILLYSGVFNKGFQYNGCLRIIVILNGFSGFKHLTLVFFLNFSINWGVHLSQYSTATHLIIIMTLISFS